MTYTEPIKIVRDIIKTYMGLSDDRVIIYNQKWNIPNSSDIFITLSNGPEKILSNSNRTEDRGDIVGLYEVQTLQLYETFYIDIMSADNSSRLRKEEIILALKSTYSQVRQEINSIKISSYPVSFLDLSSVEASDRLNRYHAEIRAFTWRKYEAKIDYFNVYDYTLNTEK
jgi:hypothetical protein